MKRDNAADVDRGISLFNKGEYFEAHEAWERVWLDLNDSAERFFIQGLIKTAAALHHYRRGEINGAVRLIASGSGLIRQSARNPWMIDAEGLLEQLEVFSGKMETSTKAAQTGFPVIKKHEGS